MTSKDNQIIWNEPIISLDYNFSHLKSKYPKLSALIDSSPKYYDFQDPQFVKLLTTCILKEYHDVDIVLSDKNLIPRVPNRYVYLMWVSKIVQFFEKQVRLNNRDVIIVDIGTGASCIYCILGASMFPSWKFVGTEINPESIEFALNNNINNSNLDRITLLKIDNAIDNNGDQNEEIFSPSLTDSFNNISLKLKDRRIILSMCNPPFFDESTDRNSEEFKKKIEITNLTADSTELFYKGGEVGFVKKMISESMKHAKDQGEFAWFTSMIGKFGSLKPITDDLKLKNINNFGIFEIDPNYNRKNNTDIPCNHSNNIVRWVICWSFHGYHLPDYLGHKYNIKFRGLNGVKTTFKIDLSNCIASNDSNHNPESLFNLQVFYKKYIQVLEGYAKIDFDNILFVQESHDKTANCIKVSVPGDVWSRSFKRKLKNLQNKKQPVDKEVEAPEVETEQNVSKKRKVTIQFDKSVVGETHNDVCEFWIIYDRGKNQLIVFWSYGFNEKIFESFCGYVNRNASKR